MKLEEAKIAFIQTWGVLGSAWGIPRSMAQIHALLLANDKAMSAEEVMEAIQLSRGNVNINLRELIHWNLIAKQYKLGERKEFFVANYDIWDIAKNIAQERKKRELLPVRQFLERISKEELEGTPEEVAHFTNFMAELRTFVEQMDQLTEIMLKLNNNLFFKKMMKALA